MDFYWMEILYVVALIKYSFHLTIVINYCLTFYDGAMFSAIILVGHRLAIYIIHYPVS